MSWQVTINHNLLIVTFKFIFKLTLLNLNLRGQRVATIYNHSTDTVSAAKITFKLVVLRWCDRFSDSFNDQSYSRSSALRSPIFPLLSSDSHYPNGRVLIVIRCILTLTQKPYLQHHSVAICRKIICIKSYWLQMATNQRWLNLIMLIIFCDKET